MIIANLKSSEWKRWFAGADNDVNSADCESGAHITMLDDQPGLDPAEISEIAAFIDQCSVDVWMRVRSHLRAEWAANRVRLQEALELSGRRKAAQLSRFQSRRVVSSIKTPDGIS